VPREKITILRTPDPNLSCNEKEWKFIARSEITLETDGSLDSEKLRVLGFGGLGGMPLVRCIIFLGKKNNPIQLLL